VCADGERQVRPPHVTDYRARRFPAGGELEEMFGSDIASGHLP
jgi:hypothetical protein